MIPFIPARLISGPAASPWARLHATEFRGSAGTTSTLASLGASVGDLLVAHVILDNAVTSGGGSWTAGPTGSCLLYRTASSGDLPAGVTFGNGGGYIHIYKGASTLSLKGSGVDTNTPPLAISGFSPAINHAGLLVATRNQGAFSDVAWSAPAGATLRENRQFTQSSSDVQITLYDRLYPANAAYDGSAFSFSWGTGANSATKMAWVYEFLR